MLRHRSDRHRGLSRKRDVQRWTAAAGRAAQVSARLHRARLSPEQRVELRVGTCPRLVISALGSALSSYQRRAQPLALDLTEPYPGKTTEKPDLSRPGRAHNISKKRLRQMGVGGCTGHTPSSSSTPAATSSHQCASATPARPAGNSRSVPDDSHARRLPPPSIYGPPVPTISFLPSTHVSIEIPLA